MKTSFCTKCQQEKPVTRFSKNKKVKSGYSSHCYDCNTQASIERRWANKRKIVDMLGDKCYDCNGTFPLEVYDFHHEDPNYKEARPSNLIRTRSIERALEELKKCILLCSNCHRIRHWSRENKLSEKQRQILAETNGASDQRSLSGVN